MELADVVATSVIGYPEADASVARRYRERALTKTEFTTTLERFGDTWFRFLAVVLGMPTYLRAGTLAVKYALRGMDAIHLASYVEVLEHGDAEFLSHDRKLMQAALKQRKALRKGP